MSLRTLVTTFLLSVTISNMAFAQELEEEIYDPLEPVNRVVFDFNNFVDRNALEPVATQYKKHIPDPIQNGVSNFFNNLQFPIRLVSDLVQLKFEQGLVHSGRFLINSTLGLAGVLEVADRFGLERHYEDFGIALAYHGIPAGPYIVLPFLGPSTLRDTAGQVVDNFLDPSYYAGATGLDSDVSQPLTIGGNTIRIINLRASLIEAINAGREASLDFYLFSQSAYYQFRHGRLHDLSQSPVPAQVALDNEEMEDEVFLDYEDE